MWVIVSQGTTGDGTSQPMTHVGRLAAVIVIVSMAIILAFLTSSTTRSLLLSNEEELLLAKHKRNEFLSVVINSAARIIQHWWRNQHLYRASQSTRGGRSQDRQKALRNLERLRVARNLERMRTSNKSMRNTADRESSPVKGLDQTRDTKTSAKAWDCLQVFKHPVSTPDVAEKRKTLRQEFLHAVHVLKHFTQGSDGSILSNFPVKLPVSSSPLRESIRASRRQGHSVTRSSFRGHRSLAAGWSTSERESRASQSRPGLEGMKLALPPRRRSEVENDLSDDSEFSPAQSFWQAHPLRGLNQGTDENTDDIKAMLSRIESRMDGMQGAIKLLNQKFDSLMEQQYMILTEKEQELLEEEQMSAARSETSENKFFGEFAGGMRPNFPFSSGGIVRMQCDAPPTFTRDKSESDTELDTFITDNSAMANTDRLTRSKREDALPARAINGITAKMPVFPATSLPANSLPATAPSPSPVDMPNARAREPQLANEWQGTQVNQKPASFLSPEQPDLVFVAKSPAARRQGGMELHKVTSASGNRTRLHARLQAELDLRRPPRRWFMLQQNLATVNVSSPSWVRSSDRGAREHLTPPSPWVSSASPSSKHNSPSIPPLRVDIATSHLTMDRPSEVQAAKEAAAKSQPGDGASFQQKRTTVGTPRGEARKESARGSEHKGEEGPVPQLFVHEFGQALDRAEARMRSKRFSSAPPAHSSYRPGSAAKFLHGKLSYNVLLNSEQIRSSKSSRSDQG